MTAENGRIENAPANEVQELFKEARKDIVFLSRPKRFGTIKIEFKTEKIAKKYASKNLISQKCKIFLMYMGRKKIRVRVGGIYPEHKAEWIIASLVNGLEEEYELVNTSVMQVVDW